MSSRPLAALAALAALLVLGAAPARAAGAAEVGMEDERLLLGDQAEAARVVDDWKDLGVRMVRLHAHWWTIAPARDAMRPPRRFDQSDPKDPHYNWWPLDNAIALVRAAGMRVMLTVTGPGPLWTSREPWRHNPVWKPDARAFGRFARAVARRYRGQIDSYLIWNEPNFPSWLMPQWTCVRRYVCAPAAPHIYRGLVRAAAPAIRAADPGAKVIAGELAPIGLPPRTASTRMAPLTFLRAMACVDAFYRPLRSGPCGHFRPATPDGLGYHPHPVLNPPDRRNPDRNSAQMGDLGRLFAVLDRLSLRGRLGRGRLPVYLTEFGYQTSPPDHAIGITLAQQTRYLQQAAFIAWQRRRVRVLTFYQWEDEPVHWRGPGTRAYAGWQSGLRFVNGRPKPVFTTFAAPFVIAQQPGRRSALLWGQVRPAALHTVTILVRPRGARSFRPLATATTDAQGYWTRTMVVSRRAAYRFLWTPLKGRPQLSGVVDLARPEPTALRAAAALARR